MRIGRLVVSVALVAGLVLIDPPPPVVAQSLAQTDLTPRVRTQIQALLAEKAARTPAQRKISSRLILERRRQRGQTLGPGLDALSTGLTLGTGGTIDLDVRVNAAPPAVLAAIAATGAQILESAPEFRTVFVRATLDQAELIASLPEVRSVRPKERGLTRGVRRTREHDSTRGWLGSAMRHVLGAWGPPASAWPFWAVTSQGDATHQAALARSTFGVDGTGVKIGVLSDGVDGLATSQANGELGPVTVLPGQDRGTGNCDGRVCAEGTAMLEIIHDLAPGAQLYFATAFTSITSFASNIRALRAAGCDIIVDDVFYLSETPFQDGQAGSVSSTTNGGVVMQAVKDVSDDGALYFSSAGNQGNLDAGTSGTWEGDFVDGDASPPPISAGRVHSFGGQTYDVLTTSGLGLTLHWSDPLGASANDYDLFLLSSDGMSIVGVSDDTQTGTQDPYEEIYPGAPAGRRAVIVKYSGSSRFLHLSNVRGRLATATTGETHGHAAVSAATSFGVAATPAVSPGPYPSAFNASNTIESFSSDGPRRMFFASDGAAYTPGNLSATGGTLLNKPDITAADGVSTSVSGFTTFYGTSAAAPHAAAIAALIKSAKLSQTAAEVRSVMTSTAIDIHAAGVDRDSGSGIVMAYSAVQTAQFFTDNPLAAGVTPIKAVHFTELRSRINTLRVRYMLEAYSWTDSTLTAGVTTIKAVHITEMRAALDAAYEAHDLPPPSYTDTMIVAGSTMVLARQLNELRARVLAIW